MSATAIDCQLSLNQIIINSLGGAMRTLLRTCAERVDKEFHNLCLLEDEERLEAIIKLFGLEEEDTVKIIKPAKKTPSGTEPAKKTPKAKAEKKIPVPFWVWVDKRTGQQKSTVNPNLCQGLTAGLYSQCQNKVKDGCEYCIKCQKEVDASDDGLPKRGNIAMRTEQFEDNKYIYAPPNSKQAKKIYPLEWALKNKFTKENFDEMLSGTELSDKAKADVSRIPEKKVRKVKTPKNNLTEDMNDNDNDNDDEDDNKSICSEYSQASEANLDMPDEDEDEDDVPYSPEEPAKVPEKAAKVPEKVAKVPEKVVKSPEPKPKSVLKKPQVIDIGPYRTVSLGRDENKKRYAVLKEDASNEKFDVYEISDYKSNKDFKIVSTQPIGEFDTTTRELNLY